MAKSTTDLMEKAALQITAPAKVVPNSRAVLFSKANKALKNIKMISALAASSIYFFKSWLWREYILCKKKAKMIDTNSVNSPIIKLEMYNIADRNSFFTQCVMKMTKFHNGLDDYKVR
ncbi:hypothetical protein YC2023_061629 [Brassica napus]